ncbi:MAG: hypothetical protein H6839_00910 [Planctomycetes bacterium]|nr:hypothetical protein [Planctomycetota bacterium]
MNDSKTRVWTRLSLAGVLVVLFAGITVGGAMIGAQDGTKTVDNPAPLDEATQRAIDAAVKKALAQAEADKPQPRRTAYVDFLTLLKSDKPLAIKQQEEAEKMDETMADIEKRWGDEIKAQQRERELHKPNTHEYRQAMQRQLDAAKNMYEEKLQYEQLAKSELRDFGIDRFKALKNLAADMAKEVGYNEVLNIVHDIEDVTAQEDSFQALQQQLLISPVLYYEPEHDITAKVQAEADKRWGSNISIVPFDAKTGSGGVSFTIEGGATKLKRNADGEIEIRLGQNGNFAVEVLEKDQHAEGDKAKVRWSKRGINVGDLGADGGYKAPDTFPLAGDTFVITARSAVDPTVSEDVTIRLLDKDGNRMKAKEGE